MRSTSFSLILVLLLAASTNPISAQQVPQSFPYQGLARNGNAVVTGTVGLRFALRQGSLNGPVVFEESLVADTNPEGVFSVHIGLTNPGPFAAIDWAQGPYFLQVGLDPQGGANYTDLGTTPILSVPYALYAESATSSVRAVVSDSAVIAGTALDDLDRDPTNELQTLSLTGNTLSLSHNGGTITLPTSDPNHTHGNITQDGKIGSQSGRIITTGTDGVLQATAGTAAGQMLYWNGSDWVIVPPGSTGQKLTFCNGVPTWGACNYPIGSVFCDSGEAAVIDVINPITGKVWMDRNLGAHQVATSSGDVNSFGDLYQWGRRSDGHQCRTSLSINTLSIIDQPAHENFILSTNSPNDWRSVQNNNLWQGINGVNNPCPIGYRLPTISELIEERDSWNVNGTSGAFSSPLKIPLAGFRQYSTGIISNVGFFGSYWSSTVNGTRSQSLSINDNVANPFSSQRAYGYSVRCIKN